VAALRQVAGHGERGVALVARGEDVCDDVRDGERRELGDWPVEQPCVPLAPLAEQIVVAIEASTELVMVASSCRLRRGDVDKPRLRKRSDLPTARPDGMGLRRHRLLATRRADIRRSERVMEWANRRR
jgi:hypothetical protein